MNVEENPLAVSLDKGAAAESLKKHRSLFKRRTAVRYLSRKNAAGGADFISERV